MMPSCQNCHAGVEALHPSVEPLASGVRLQVVRCLLCGWQVERVAPGPVAVRRDSAPQVFAAEVPAAVRRSEAFRTRMSSVQLALRQQYAQPCQAPGCPGVICTMTNKSGLCTACGRKLRNYEWRKRVGKVTPSEPPLRKVGGVWRWRQDLAPGGGR